MISATAKHLEHRVAVREDSDDFEFRRYGVILLFIRKEPDGASAHTVQLRWILFEAVPPVEVPLVEDENEVLLGIEAKFDTPSRICGAAAKASS